MNNTNKWIVIGLVVLVVITVGIWSGKRSAKTMVDEKVSFGALVPLTGQVSVLGERMRNGMELAHQDITSSGILPNLEMIYEDACDGKTSTNAVNKLVYQNKVKVISSSFCLFGMDAVTPTTEKEKVIMFNTAANPESALNRKYLFSTNVAIRDDSKQIAEYATTVLNAKTAAIVYLDSSFGHSYNDNFSKYFIDNGGRMVISEAVPFDATEFRSVMTKVRGQKPDVLIVIHFGISAGNAIKQARELGVTAPIIGDYETEDPTIIKFAGSATEGVLFSSSQPKEKTQNIIKFEERYMQAYGELPDVLATNAYDAVMLQARAYAKCDGDTDCMSTELESVRNHDGVSGNITINPDHSVSKPTIFKVIRGGKFVELNN